MPTEQLKIDAKLQTDDLKRKSKNASEEMKRDMQGVENQADKTSKSIEKIGNASDTASSSATKLESSFGRSLDNINAKAEQAKKAMQQMAAIGVGSQLLGAAGSAISKTNWGKNTTEGQATAGALGGAGSMMMSGAMLGTMLGGPGAGTLIGAGLGAAAGALTGAAGALNEAAQKQKEAALAAVKDRDAKAESYRRDVQNYERSQRVQNEIANFADFSAGERKSELGYYQDSFNATQEKYFAAVRQYQANKSTISRGGLSKAEQAAADAKFNEEQETLLQQMEEYKNDLERMAKVLTAVGKMVEEDERLEQEKQEALEQEKEAQKELADARKERAEKEKKAADAIAKSFEEAAVGSEIKNSTDRMKNLESSLRSESGKSNRITDSLVRVGGGGSYAGVNNAINNNVGKIVSKITELLSIEKGILSELQNRKEMIGLGWT